ncbi:hypothetical protein KNP414_03354 [Paenibacillus mucilaginosus KNP414]|uniref:Uncharacterized protein n=1 Tax=Paenibacillus mucilaginosus (strain KNP414) TaxID=1036673 RepID=F8F624_PAEMK|nr:hypothetical protein KNP414_03354 [Paenibacillus mucilaginosus KNP414]
MWNEAKEYITCLPIYTREFFVYDSIMYGTNLMSLAEIECVKEQMDYP